MEAVHETTAVDTATGLSNNGHVVGRGTAPADEPEATYAYAWLAGRLGRVRQDPGEPVWLRSWGRDVNEEGAVVGIFGLNVGISQFGFHWKNGEANELLDPSGFGSFPHAINASGWTVGDTTIVTQPGIQAEAVLWDPGLNPSWVGNFVSAQDINELGVVAGRAPDANGLLFAAVYDSGSTTILGTLDPGGVGTSTAFAINDASQVVGTSKVGLTERAFSWTATTGMVELPGVGVPGIGAYASAINAAGLILGSAPIAAGGSAPVIWDEQLVPHLLSDLAPDMGPGQKWLSVGVPQDINDWGQISGTAFHEPSGMVRAYLMTPADLSLQSVAPPAAGSAHTVVVSGAAPSAEVLLFGAADHPLDIGFQRILSCGGMGLSMVSPRVLASASADAAGVATLTWTVPAALAGAEVRFQAAAPATCDVSNVAEFTL